jgi:hypothetical protein
VRAVNAPGVTVHLLGNGAREGEHLVPPRTGPEGHDHVLLYTPSGIDVRLPI